MATRKTEPDSRAIAGTKLAIRAQVMNDLADAHADEFHHRMAEAYTHAGLLYERPLTDKEKAAAQLETIRKAYPDLFTDRDVPVVISRPEEGETVEIESGVDDDIRSMLA